MAIHYVFDTPYDRLIWDVGHQAYPHKILTGRRDRIRTIRQGGGLSGFTKRSESEYDPFGAAHSSTSISAGLGMAVASDLMGRKRNVISVIGDGAMTAGMAYEAMNNAGSMKNRLIVILNDNDMSIAPPVGALERLSVALADLDAVPLAAHDRQGHVEDPAAAACRKARRAPKNTPAASSPAAARCSKSSASIMSARSTATTSTTCCRCCRTCANSEEPGPVLVHVVTQKGKGYAPAEKSADKYHGVVKFDVATGAQAKSTPKAPSYTSVFAKALIAEAKVDERIVAINAAMPSGTGCDAFGKEFPKRCFDVAHRRAACASPSPPAWPPKA